MHLCSPVSFLLALLLPPISSSQSPLSYFWQTPTQRDLTLPLAAPHGAVRPTGASGQVECKHGDRWRLGQGALVLGMRDCPRQYSSLSPPAVTSKRVHVSVALRNWESGWRDMTWKRGMETGCFVLSVSPAEGQQDSRVAAWPGPAPLPFLPGAAYPGDHHDLA